MQAFVKSFLFSLADEVVDVCEEDKRTSIPPSVIRHAIVPLLQEPDNQMEVIAELSPSSSSCIVQPKVLLQTKNDSCGFYALNNLLCIAAAITAPTKEVAVAALKQTKDRTHFWLMYDKLIRQLKRKYPGNSHKKYPWSDAHIEKGILERPHIAYLLSGGFISNNIEITVLSDFSFLGMRHNRLPIEDLEKISRIFSLFNMASSSSNLIGNDKSKSNVTEREVPEMRSLFDDLTSTNTTATTTATTIETTTIETSTTSLTSATCSCSQTIDQTTTTATTTVTCICGKARQVNSNNGGSNDSDDSNIKTTDSVISSSSNNSSHGNDKNNSNGNRAHAFLIGQTCHWISVICNKVGERVEILVFDSRNHNLLTSTQEDFEKIINEHKTLPAWKRDIYMCSLNEPQHTAWLFHDAIMGIRDVVSALLEPNMDAFLSSFDQHVEQAEVKDVWVVLFMSWLEVYWPPPVVESNIIKILEKVGVAKLSHDTKKKFVRMAKSIRESVDFGGCGVAVVQRFETVVMWLEVAFSSFIDQKGNT